MDAVEFLKATTRMCSIEHCSDCPLSYRITKESCLRTIIDHPEKSVASVEKWAKEHPKTRQLVFLEQHPKAFVEADGVLGLHPCEIDITLGHELCYVPGSVDRNCAECRKTYWLAPAEEEKK